MAASRGRPLLSCRVVHFRLTLSLREGEDDDLIRFLSSALPRQRAAMIKTGLRRGCLPTAISAADDGEDLAAAVGGLLFG